MRVLGLIPARGGSKGVPRKNIRLLAGKPLIQYTADAALAAKRLTDVVLTTEDEEIAEVGRQCGLKVPFLRPMELAQDATPTLSAVQHALRTLAELGDTYDAVCLLQPTNPLRNPQDIDNAIELFETQKLDCVLSMLPVPHEYNPHWVYKPKEDGTFELFTGGTIPIPRRQSLPPAYHREGSIYITKTDIVLNQDSLYGEKVGGYIMQQAQPVNIDTMEDWALAEQVMAKLLQNA